MSPLGAVTVTTRLFSPILRVALPDTEISASGSAVVPYTLHSVVFEPTLTVYSVTEAENLGDKTPALVLREERFALVDFEASETLIVAEAATSISTGGIPEAT